MAWINALYQTYDNCSAIAGKEEAGKAMLLPISHSTQNAQIEIILDMNSQFIRASIVPKADAETLIQVTEDSASRGNGVTPHPLNDKLCYIAGDYDQYVVSKKEKRAYFEAYIKALREWSSSSYTHEKVKIICKYLEKQSVMKDLIHAKIIEMDEDGNVTIHKIEGISQEDSFVRFIVEKVGEDPNCYTRETWKDRKLQQNFIDYFMSVKSNSELCYVTGKQTEIAIKHPSKIRNTGDKSKLISSNDNSGFTYRGRFTEANQSASVGYTVSQKAHNALRWLIAKQGWRNGSANIISWSIDGCVIPDPMESTKTFFGHIGEKTEKAEIDTAESYAERLNKAIAGYKADLTTAATIVVMGVDTADGAQQGRLAITFYREIEGNEFLENIKNWHEHCAWRQRYKNEESRYYDFIGAPSPKDIALSTYGIERSGMLKADDKLIHNCVERILPCIVGKQRFPADILYTAVRNASRPITMGHNNWNRVVANTCGIIRFYYYQKYREELNMALNTKEKDRSYLFGRLLAVADRAEYRTYESNENRTTNAKRYWNIFTKKPAKTWQIIYEKILPYQRKLELWEQKKYNHLIEEIVELMENDDFNNTLLSEKYLLGYENQSYALRNTVKINEESKLEDEKR
ncbi:MAG: type I-C CRISPR-associated protein Cas8c/Csd1 [Eubacterium sp.]